MKALITLLRNLKFLCMQDLRRVEWRLWMMERSTHSLGAFVLNSSGPIEVKSEINNHEYSIHSQFGEDGILSWIFSRIQPQSKVLIEIGCGSGRQCNTANMILNAGWQGLLIDGSMQNIKEARNFFKYLMPWSQFEKLDFECHFITRDNVEEVITRRKNKASPDLLTIDVDGNDYWVWERVTNIDPAVVVMEYNSTYGHDESIVTPYNPEFDAYRENPFGLYHGASLVALCNLGKKKGYVLIGCDSNGANAFFVKKEYKNLFTEVSPKEAFYENQHKKKRGTVQYQFNLIQDKPFVRM